MNLAFSQYDLCGDSDITNYLSSPEVPLAMTRVNSVLIGITASAGSAVITAGVLHGLIPGHLVLFSTAGTLPSPLAASVDYYVIATPTTTTFTVAAVLGGTPVVLTTTGTGQSSMRDDTILSFVRTKRSLAKNVIRQMILVNLKQRVPELIGACLSYKRMMFNKFVRGIEYDVGQILDAAPLDSAGVITSNGIILDVFVFLNSAPQMRPVVFVNFGIPTSGTSGFQAGATLTGDLCIDTSTWNQIYINKGTDTNSPNWVAEYTAKDAMDNLLNAGIGRIDLFEIQSGGSGYAVNDTGTVLGGTLAVNYTVTTVAGGVVTGILLDTTGAGYTIGILQTQKTTGSGSGLSLDVLTLKGNELLDAAVYQTTIQMMNDGEFRNMASLKDPNSINYFAGMQKKMEKDFFSAMSRALPLLEVDIDGNGIIYDAERRLMDTSLAVIG